MVCDNAYTIVRTWTVSDCSGNSTEHVQSIEVVDTTAPVFEAHEEFTMASCGDLTDATDPTQVPLTATDNCGTITYTIDALMFSGGCPGTWMRQWTATMLVETAHRRCNSSRCTTRGTGIHINTGC